VASSQRRKAARGKSPALETWIRWSRFSNLEGLVPVGTSLTIYVIILDAVQILFLAVVPSPGISQNLIGVFPTPTVGAYLHVFLGNAFIGTQELIPFFSVFAFGRSLYLLLAPMTLLGNTWHATQAEVVGRLFSFGYSWLEISTYSYAFIKSFDFVRRILGRSLTPHYVLKTWCIVIVGLGLAAVLELLALTVV
jgi:hypothetical protein